MADNLFPEGYEEEVILEEDLEENKESGYKNGVAFENGDFLRDGKNQLLDSDGIESWKAWCYNCLMTERYKHLAYSTDLGLELEPVFKAESREEAEVLLTREITEAILADPYERSSYISEIVYNWTAPDAVEVTVTIRGIDDVTIDVTAYITKGEL